MKVSCKAMQTDLATLAHIDEVPCNNKPCVRAVLEGTHQTFAEQFFRAGFTSKVALAFFQPSLSKLLAILECLRYRIHALQISCDERCMSSRQFDA